MSKPLLNAQPSRRNGQGVRGVKGRRKIRRPSPDAPSKPPKTFKPVPQVYTSNLVPNNDRDRGKALVGKMDGNFRFVSDLGKGGTWVHWDKDQWTHDRSEAAVQGCIDQLLEVWKSEAQWLAQQALALNDTAQTIAKAQAKIVAQYALAARSRAAMDNMRVIAQRDSRVSVKIADFDTNPMLLGVQNGIVDLSTGEFRPAQPDDMILKRADVVFDSKATCPQWLEFLNQILPDPEIVKFLQQFFGYSLTGEVTEQVLPFLYGQGANGKSTLLSVVEEVFGDYAWKTSAQLFLSGKADNSKDNMLANLQHRRFVIGAEMSANARLDEAMIKDLTGGDKLMARRLFNEAFNFRPSHKLLFYGNHQPIVHGVDEGIWRRILHIPFNVQIPPEKQDKKLVARLLKEKPGIFNWMLAGCLDWGREKKLSVPECIRASTQEYRDSEDVIGEFLSDQCQKTGEVSRSELMLRYQQWAGIQGHKYTFSPRSVADRVRREPGVSEGRRKINGVMVRVWIGLSLNP